MIVTFSILFLLAAGVVGLLASIILLFITKENKAARFLGLHLLVICLQIFYMALWENKVILEIPHIFRLNHPLLLLCAPSLYIYIHGILLEKKFNLVKIFLHFTPAVFTFIYYTPVYFIGSEKKLRLINEAYILFEKEEPPDFGFEDIYPLFLIVSVCVYSVLIFVAYVKYKKQNAAIKKTVNFLKWLKMLFRLSFIYLIVLIAVNGFVNSDEAATVISQFIVGLHILTLSLTLFFNPNILYGIDVVPGYNYSIVNLTNKRKLIISSSQKEEHIQILQCHLQTNPFLRYNYSQKIMAEETKIPVHHLSYIINDHYKMNYNEFINKLRIEYLLKEINSKRWQNYSIDGIAKEVGFKSKSTFVAAFKKITGTTPSNYLKDYLVPGNNE